MTLAELELVVWNACDSHRGDPSADGVWAAFDAAVSDPAALVPLLEAVRAASEVVVLEYRSASTDEGNDEILRRAHRLRSALAVLGIGPTTKVTGRQSVAADELRAVGEQATLICRALEDHATPALVPGGVACTFCAGGLASLRIIEEIVVSLVARLDGMHADRVSDVAASISDAVTVVGLQHARRLDAHRESERLDRLKALVGMPDGKQSAEEIVSAVEAAFGARGV